MSKPLFQKPNWLETLVRDCRGVATSLLEATATIAVGATLAAAAVSVVSDKVHDMRILAATVDLEAIADAINKFYKDNNFFPIYLTGNTIPSSATSQLADVLKSKNGDEASVTASPTKDEGAWTGETNPFGFSETVRFDFLENQLVENSPGKGTPTAGLGFFGFDTASQGYPRAGESALGAKHGYTGPYLANPPSTDPWGNKYYVNIKFLQPKELETRRTVVALCAGPNETIQTPFTLAANGTDKIKAVGDDIVERLR